MLLGATLSVFSDIYDLNQKIDEKEKELIVKYEKALFLPRKAKKQAKKKILLEWSINQYGKELMKQYNF